MKINRIAINTLLGIRQAELASEKSVWLIAGRNGAGKSSILHLVRMALDDRMLRVDLKKEGRALVHRGAKSGDVRIEIEGTEGASFIAPSCKRESPVSHYALPYVLDPLLFFEIDDNERRRLLFSLCKVENNPATITRLLIERGHAKALVDTLAPEIRTGAEVARDRAKALATEARGAWRRLTADNYGSVKAATWVATPAHSLAYEPEIVAEEKAKAADRRHLINEAQNAHSELIGRMKQADADRVRREHLQKSLSTLPALQATLTEQRATFERENAALKAAESEAGEAPDGKEMDCPHCGAAVIPINGKLVKARGERPPYNADAAARANGHKQQAGAAAREIARLESEIKGAQAAEAAFAKMSAEILPPTQEEVTTILEMLQTLRNELAVIDQTVCMYEDAKRAREEAEKKTAAARELHVEVEAWDAIATALAPDGIPGEFMHAALDPVNEHMGATSALVNWRPVSIDADMVVRYGNRAYELLSDSEQWRCRMIVAEAISHLSGLRLLVLDHADILDPREEGGRTDLVRALDTLAKAQFVDTVLVAMTTISTPNPRAVPDSIAVFWVEDCSVPCCPVIEPVEEAA